MSLFAKPRAAIETRVIRLEGQEIPYLLKRSPKRRTIGLSIDHRGLTVSAPLRAVVGHLEQVLQERSGWLFDKLREWQERQPASFNCADGETLLFLGSELVLRLIEGGPRVQSNLLEDDTLVVTVPNVEDAVAVRRKLEQWYRAEARRHFMQRLEHYASCMGLKVRNVALSGARTRWGSCNAKGDIRLSWRLIQAPISQIDYVVVHELAHIRELNHSPRFWAIVEETLPHYAKAQRALKTGGASYHRF